MADVLKEKSLVSFSINRHGLVRRTLPFCSFNLFDVLKEWPRLHYINIEGFDLFRGCKDFSEFDSSSATYYLPELRDIVITRLDIGSLTDTEFNTLRVRCGSVTNLSVSGWLDEESVRKALCRCLCEWSPTLDCVSLQIIASQSMYSSIFETLSALTGLRELQIYAPRLTASFVNFGHIARIPRLDRFCFATESGMSSAEIHGLSEHLEDWEKFPSLQRIVTLPICGEKNTDRLMSACLQRGVEWEATQWKWGDQDSISGLVL